VLLAILSGVEVQLPIFFEMLPIFDFLRDVPPTAPASRSKNIFVRMLERTRNALLCAAMQMARHQIPPEAEHCRYHGWFFVVDADLARLCSGPSLWLSSALASFRSIMHVLVTHCNLASEVTIQKWQRLAVDLAQLRAGIQRGGCVYLVLASFACNSAQLSISFRTQKLSARAWLDAD